MHSYSRTPVQRYDFAAFRCSLIRSSIIALGLVLGITLMDAQVPKIPKVGQEELASHLMTYVAPVYSTSAISSHIQGDVVANVEISPDGLVRFTRVISGPPALRQVVVTALKQWRYSPFHVASGTIAVTGDVLVSFTLLDKPAVHTPHEASANGSYSVTLPPPDHRGEPDAEIANRFDIPWETCTRGVIAQATDESTASACRQAASIAAEFPKDRRFRERRMAYVYAATAYGNIHDFETALQYADKAVEIAALEHADNSGSAAAYSIRAKIRAFSGDVEGGNQDISVAEGFCRSGGLSAALKTNLEFHAELLKRMNRPQEAEAKLEEAAKL
jgi:Gram-negative bacterial TonB protein C-terminal